MMTAHIPTDKKPLRLAINGFGRIGRNVLRAYLSRMSTLSMLDLIAINDVADADTLLHLLNYDSTHGRLSTLGVSAELHAGKPHSTLQLIGSITDTPLSIALFNQSNPEDLPWHALSVDVVLECSGHFRSYSHANMHRQAGAQQVIIGAAPFNSVDASVVVGVNDDILTATGSHAPRIISGVSCTTQALVPLLWLLDNAYGVDSVMMTEIHAVTTDQMVLDKAHRDLRRARASGHNIIPTTSSSIAATTRVLPHMAGKIDGHSIRVPTINVAAIDVTMVLNSKCSLSSIRQTLKTASTGNLKGIMGYEDAPLVSSDFIGDAHSLIIDGGQMMMVGRQLKVFAWYDNEWGYANRLLDMCLRLAQTQTDPNQ